MRAVPVLLSGLVLFVASPASAATSWHPALISTCGAGGVVSTLKSTSVIIEQLAGTCPTLTSAAGNKTQWASKGGSIRVNGVPIKGSVKVVWATGAATADPAVATINGTSNPVGGTLSWDTVTLDMARAKPAAGGEVDLDLTAMDEVAPAATPGVQGDDASLGSSADVDVAGGGVQQMKISRTLMILGGASDGSTPNAEASVTAGGPVQIKLPLPTQEFFDLHSLGLTNVRLYGACLQYTTGGAPPCGQNFSPVAEGMCGTTPTAGGWQGAATLGVFRPGQNYIKLPAQVTATGSSIATIYAYGTDAHENDMRNRGFDDATLPVGPNIRMQSLGVQLCPTTSASRRPWHGGLFGGYSATTTYSLAGQTWMIVGNKLPIGGQNALGTAPLNAGSIRIDNDTAAVSGGSFSDLFGFTTLAEARVDWSPASSSLNLGFTLPANWTISRQSNEQLVFQSARPYGTVDKDALRLIDLNGAACIGDNGCYPVKVEATDVGIAACGTIWDGNYRGGSQPWNYNGNYFGFNWMPSSCNPGIFENSTLARSAAAQDQIAPALVGGQVRGRGHHRKLWVHWAAHRDHRIRLVELGPGPRRQVLGTLPRGRLCGEERHSSYGRYRCATIPFTSNLGPAGTRVVVAEVERHGINGVQQDIPVARVRSVALDPGRSRLHLRRQGRHVELSWSGASRATVHRLNVMVGREHHEIVRGPGFGRAIVTFPDTSPAVLASIIGSADGRHGPPTRAGLAPRKDRP